MGGVLEKELQYQGGSLAEIAAQIERDENALLEYMTTGDFSVCEKSLGECVIRALHLMEKDPPRYYRLEEYMIGKGLWKQL